jgi:tetratricopeptide (TPR) repeat protein
LRIDCALPFTNLTIMRRLIPAVSLFLSTALSAQSAPKRPKLDKDADPNDWRSYYMAGVKRLPVNPSQSAELFWWASRLSPGSAEPLHMRWVALSLANAKLLEEEPRAGSAEERLSIGIDSVLFEAFGIDPFTPRQYSRLVYDAMPGSWGNDAFTKGFLAYTEGRYDLATSYLRKATGGRFARSARYYRALSFHAQQRFDSAATELEALAAMARGENERRLRQVYDTPAVYEYGVGIAKLRLKDLDGARAALLRALEEDVSFAAAHSALAWVAQQKGDTAEMLRELQMAVDLRPTSGAAHDAYGTALRLAGRLDESAAEYERAIALEPYWAAPYYNLALVLELAGRKADAARRYGEFAERAPVAYAEQVAHAQARAAALATP